MPDEAANISNKENFHLLDLLMWLKISKGFDGYHLFEEGTTREAIKRIIIDALSELRLSMSNCCGQSYDGTGDMVGWYIGVSTLIQQEISKGVHDHCMNH